MEPVASTSASERPFILVAAVLLTQERVPEPSVFNNWFAEPSSVGRVMAVDPNPRAAA